MSFAHRAYGHDLYTFLDRANLDEVTAALYEVALRIEDGRASGGDFYSELRYVLGYVYERGFQSGREYASASRGGDDRGDPQPPAGGLQ